MFDSPFHTVLDFRPTESSRRLIPVFFLVVAATIYSSNYTVMPHVVESFFRTRHIMVPEVVRDSGIYGNGKQLKTG